MVHQSSNFVCVKFDLWFWSWLLTSRHIQAWFVAKIYTGLCLKVPYQSASHWRPPVGPTVLLFLSTVSSIFFSDFLRYLWQLLRLWLLVMVILKSVTNLDLELQDPLEAQMVPQNPLVEQTRIATKICRHTTKVMLSSLGLLTAGRPCTLIGPTAVPPEVR